MDTCKWILVADWLASYVTSTCHKQQRTAGCMYVENCNKTMSEKSYKHI